MKKNKRKKILYVITKSDPWGGAQKYVYDLVTRLPKETYDVAVVLGGNGPLKQKLEEAKIRTIAIDTLQRDIHIGKEIRAFSSLYTIFKTEKPDVIHLNSSKVGGLGALAGRLTHVQHILFTSHGLPFEEDRSALTRLVIRFFTWITFLLSHHVILISKATFKRASHMPFVRHKLSLIYNAVDDIAFKEKKMARTILAHTAGILESKYTEDTLWIGTIAELHKNKGLSYLIDALKIVVEEHTAVLLLVIGEGELHNILEKHIAEHNLAEHVFLVGYVANAASLLKAFDVFTLSSVKEGHPYTLLEAGMAGIPVVGSCISGIEDMIDDMETGMLVRPRQPKEIADALSYLYTHPEQRQKFGTAFSEKVHMLFQMDHMYTQTTALYHKS